MCSPSTSCPSPLQANLPVLRPHEWPRCYLGNTRIITHQYALDVCPEHLSARRTYGSFRFTFSAIIVIIVKHRVLIVFLPFCASPPPSLLFAKCHLRAHRVPHRRSQSATSSIANLHHHFFFNKLNKAAAHPIFGIQIFIYSFIQIRQEGFPKAMSRAKCTT